MTRAPLSAARFTLPLLMLVIGTGITAAYLDRPALLATAMVLCALACGSLYLGWARAGFLSWHALVPLYYLIFFLVAPLLEQATGAVDYVTVPNSVGALALLTLSLAVFAASAQVTLSGIGHSSLRVCDRFPLRFTSEFPTLLLFFLIGWAAKYYSITSGYFGLTTSEETRVQASALAGIASVVSNCTVIALAASWHHRYLDLQSKKWLTLALISFALEFSAGLLASSKTALLAPIIVVLGVGALHGRAPKRATIVGVALFAIFVAFPFVYFSRIAARLLPTDDKIDFYSHILQILVSGDWLNFVDDSTFAVSAAQSLGRGLLLVLINIIDQIGNYHTALLGQTYLTEMATFVPRFLWPAKPDLNIGNFVGHFLGLIPATDQITNISPSQPGFMYMNFGIIGVLVGMTAWGLIATAMIAIFGRRSWFVAIIATDVVWQEKGISPLLFFCRDLVIAMVILLLCHGLYRLLQLGRKARSDSVVARPGGLAGPPLLDS
jgi:hypothetical protein